jgi:hypothetical protein
MAWFVNEYMIADALTRVRVALNRGSQEADLASWGGRAQNLPGRLPGRPLHNLQ